MKGHDRYRYAAPLVSVLAVLLLTLSAPGSGAWHQGATAVGAPGPGAPVRTGVTTVHIFRPWAAGGHLAPGIRIIDILSGHCYTGSLVTVRADAWRCFVGNNGLIDPCFAPTDTTARAVLCAPDPTAGHVYILLLTAPLPLQMANKGKPGDGDPWAIILAGGRRCDWISGATTKNGAGRLNYGCTPSGNVYGDVDRSTQPWTVRAWLGPYNVIPKPAQLVRMAVTNAWF